MTYEMKRKKGGYTLVEMIVAVGLFAFVMTLSTGAYLMMIGLNRQAQALATGIDNLSFALEAMVRDIRTGTAYDCGGSGDCPSGSSSFSFRNRQGVPVTYSLASSVLQKTINSTTNPMTDPAVNISSLTFYAFGTQASPSDYQQSRVTVIVSGTVSAGPGKTQSFLVETGATMRGSDI